MQSGAAGQTGEEMEQGNSYMSRCGKNSRNMEKQGIIGVFRMTCVYTYIGLVVLFENSSY